MAVATFIELEALTTALDFWVWRRRSSSWSFALASVFAVCAGIVEAFAGWAVQRAFDVPLLGRMHFSERAQRVRAALLGNALGIRAR